MTTTPAITRVLALLLVLPAGGCRDRSSGKARKKPAPTTRSMTPGGGAYLADRTGAAPSGQPSRSPAAQSLPVVGAAIQTIGERYVAPAKIMPARMLNKALEYVEAERVAVRVVPTADPKHLTVQIGDQTEKFYLGRISSLLLLEVHLKRILLAIRAALKRRGRVPEKELRDLEYAAINGVLSTLDPHSVLMPPKIYGEMRIRTRGAFGGIGIVISIRQGALTVISPIDGTPAAKAGVRAGDRIVKIEDESTINMPLSEAVARLRGKPDTRVTFWIERDGWTDPRRFSVIRRRIKIKSVTSRLLPGRIGYVRISRFSHNTTDELVEHLKKLKKADARGLILDLWNNPGGLLQQAVSVADAFLASGEIVITEAARGVVIGVRKAEPDTQVFKRPMVVLVNRGSASAAEIVAGALKNQGRAMVLGETTFGKGTVQMLFENNDGSALKLTVAQYLTPGGISIQTVGVAPDVLTNPVELREDWVRLFAPEWDARLRAKRKDLLPARQQSHPRPSFTLNYLSPKTDEKTALRSSVSENAAEAPVVELARTLLARHGGPRLAMLRNGRSYLKMWGIEQERRIIRALARRKLDWRRPPPDEAAVAPDALEIKAMVAPGPEPIAAGAKASLRLQVKNRGARAVYRLRGYTTAASYYLDEREFVIGRVGPGASRTVSLPFKIPPHVHTSLQPVTLHLKGGNLAGTAQLSTRIGIAGLRRPRLELGYRLHDDVKGNGDGRPEPGETVRLRVSLENRGAGEMKEGVVSLRNLSGKGIFIVSGRQAVKRLKPGGRRQVDLTFRILPDYRKSPIKLELAVYDGRLREGTQGTLRLPLSPAKPTARGLVGAVTPPRITTSAVPLLVAPGTTHLALNGAAHDDQEVLDIFVEVTNYDAEQIRHKAYYAAHPQGLKPHRLPFAARVPLWPGLNSILVVARENRDVMGHKRLMVLRPR